MEIHLLTFPICGYLERTTVRTGIIIAFLYVGRVRMELRCPRIAHILVDTITITMYFEEAGHGELIPLAIVIAYSKEAFGRLVMILHEVKFPLARHIDVAGTLTLVCLCCKFGVFISKIGCTCLLTVLMVHLRVKPHLCSLCIKAHGSHKCTHQKECSLHSFSILFITASESLFAIYRKGTKVI